MENCAIRICKIAGGTQLNKIQLDQTCWKRAANNDSSCVCGVWVCVCVCLCAGVLSCVTCVGVPHALSGLFWVFFFAGGLLPRLMVTANSSYVFVAFKKIDISNQDGGLVSTRYSYRTTILSTPHVSPVSPPCLDTFLWTKLCLSTWCVRVLIVWTVNHHHILHFSLASMFAGFLLSRIVLPRKIQIVCFPPRPPMPFQSWLSRYGFHVCFK